MRDAFGSTFMFKLLIIFLVVFVSFATLAVSYAKVFRLKNGVINILEQNKYNDKDQNTINKVDDYLDSKAYRYGNNQSVINNCKNQNGILTKNGACISSFVVSGKSYYRLTMYLVVNLPFFSYSAVMPISSEFTNYNNEKGKVMRP